MASFKDVIGHEQIIEHLSNSLKNKKISHAYIFCGEDGTGKNMLAKLFAKALQCEAGYGDNCGMCRSCRQVESGNQPDIRWVTHEKPASIGVDDIREQVNNDIAIKPYSSKYKIYIIDEAEKMTPQAQNALLKTIEEPPSYGVIMLLTNNMDDLLQTIRSRCVTLSLKAIPTGKIQEYLIEKYEIPDYKARICASYAQGNMGKAIRMATSDEFNELHSSVLNLVKNVDDMDIYMVMDAVKKLSEYKVEIYDIIDMMMVWYRDVLMLKLTNDPNLLVYPEEYSALSKRASRSTFEGLDYIIKAMEKAKTRLRANVNFDTALELMLLTIKEN
ncbi:DNA polymerase-3 subunit delta' [Catenibacillus scindens]|uniref:DNA polymerase III subunit delta' n=1 Tax=Catenibacillus scindens TaxID=673271 RepID=A0A7W8H9N7_9FIRM|nr:DNA polymerase III subunit delta' [Catenibacillus scindens]MBB5264003.1 DNA polymerase-3 subunit delta' [Catenibacillus scindens]